MVMVGSLCVLRRTASGFGCLQVRLERAEEFEQAWTLRGRQAGEQIDHPALVLGRHRVEHALALGGQAHRVRAAVAGNRQPLDQALVDELRR